MPRALTRVPLPLVIPPTKNHRQLAAWVNQADLVDAKGRSVRATVDEWKTNTDQKMGRLRWPGKGRRGLMLRLYAKRRRPKPDEQIYENESGLWYARHDEARGWIVRHLAPNPNPKKRESKPTSAKHVPRPRRPKPRALFEITPLVCVEIRGHFQGEMRSRDDDGLANEFAHWCIAQGILSMPRAGGGGAGARLEFFAPEHAESIEQWLLAHGAKRGIRGR
jgi:hypothetical protein